MIEIILAGTLGFLLGCLVALILLSKLMGQVIVNVLKDREK